MKRVIATLLLFALMLTLTACKKTKEQTQSDADLKEEYPMYSGLDSSGGLDVIVWQMSPSYSFALFEHSEQNHNFTFDELLQLEGGVDAEKMKILLSGYRVDEDDVHIIMWQNPFSSYIGEYWISSENESEEEAEVRRQACIDKIKAMLFEPDDK